MSRGQRHREVPIQRRVHLFLRLYAALKANPYSQQAELSITFSYGRGAGQTRVETDKPDRYVFESFMARLQQLIKDGEPVFLPKILNDLPRRIDNPELRARLAKARQLWTAAEGVPSPIAPLVLGRFASGHNLARLYLHGGVFHSDPDLSDVWDGLTADDQEFVMHAFRSYEGRVRAIIVGLKEVIDEAREGGFLRDEPLDLGA